ncbi:MAG TPA: hypothetical protein ENJ77_00680, partial [Candidatus Moranbacteria bacterium]|nr:hypothetical protein [Candidatus Moranbacteria bacterium]
MSFWQWYFYRAPREIPFLLNGFLRFVVRFFAFGKHLRTLFSPWHRDVRWRNYRGLHPLLWARLLLDNLFARLMGAIARLTVMSAGAVVLALAVTAALAAGLMWFFWPLLTIGALLWSFSSQSVWPALVGLAFFLPWAAVVYRSRTLSREEKNYRQMTLVELLREPRFERILRRLGLSKKDISPEMTRDFELFAQMLAARGIEMAEFDRLLSREIKIWEREILRKKWWREENWRTVPPLGRYWSYGWTVLLDRYGT